MTTIEVDVVFFVVDLIISIFALPFIIGWTIWKAYKTPEFWLRLRRKDWIYPLVRTPLGRLRQIAFPSDKIGENGRIKLFGGRRTYFVRDHDELGRSTVITWRYGKPGYLYDWDDPNPQAWAPNQSLSTLTNPETISNINNNNLLKQMMMADFFQNWMVMSVILSIIAIVIVGALAFIINGEVTAIDKLNHSLQNVTVVPGR